jgi:hypothetical protein
VNDASALAEGIARALKNPPQSSRVDLSPYVADAVAAAYEALAAGQPEARNAT